MTDDPPKIIPITSRIDRDDEILSSDVATCLRKWLAMAEAGEIVSVAIAAETKGGDAMIGHTIGATRFQVIGAMEALKSDLIEKRKDLE